MKHFHIRQTIVSAVVIFAVLLGIFSFAKAEDKPNILLLLADDLGYNELGCYGQKVIGTPVLDDLARQGMRFTNFYAGNSVCAPSRAVLMTGKPSGFCTVRGNSGVFSDDRWMRVPLKKDEMTVAEMLKTAGYQTAMVGKWHLDNPNDVSTWACGRGFDYAVQEQWASRFGGEFKNDEEVYKTKGEPHWVNGNKEAVYYDWKKWESKDDFRTQVILDHLDTLDKDKPFFIFMSYRAPHGHERVIGNKVIYSDQEWPEKERIHAGKITLLDKQVGRLVKKLEQMGELENTLILFTSDNGPHHEGHDPEFFDSNGELRGIKRDLYEGGVRVPLIAVWKGKIKPNIVTAHISGFQDVMATIAEAVGIAVPKQSRGISMLPVLTGKTQTKHEHLNWEFQLDGWSRKMPDGGFRQSMRMGKWKAVRYGTASKTQLYDLDKDISESNDIAADHPEIVKKINQLFEQERSETEGFPYGGVMQDYKAKDRQKKEN